jgi:hypothetical protein
MMMQKNLKYDGGFRNKSHKFEKEKANSSTYPKLYLRLDGDPDREHTNQQDWERTIRQERVGAFGKRFQTTIEKGKWDYSTLKSKLDKYPIKALKKDTDDYWKDDVTLDELQTLSLITDATEKQYKKNQMIKVWRATINEVNNEIETNNHINKNMQKLIMDEDKEFSDKSTMFFSDLFSTIAYDSQHVIQRFECKRGDVKLGKYKDRDVDTDDELDAEDDLTSEESSIYSKKNEIINYNMAMTEGNWIWLIYATRETHISVIKSNNIWEDRALMLNAERRVTSMRYKYGSIERFLLSFENAVETAMRMGSSMTEIDAILWLVNAIPDDLFETFKRDFENDRMREKFPTDYDEFVKNLKGEYDRLRIRKPKLVTSYLTRKQSEKEDSFKLGEVKETKRGGRVAPPKDGCIICGGPHWAKVCEHSLPNCTWEESKRHYESCTKDKKESHEDSDGSSASSDKDDEDDDEETDEKPTLAGKKTKASKSTVARKTTFKDEKANYCYEVNIEDVAKTRESTAVKAANVQVYDELVDVNLFAAIMRTEELTAAVRTKKKPTVTPMPPIDAAPAYFATDAKVEPDKFKAKQKFDVLSKSGDAEEIKGGTVVKLKDNPVELGGWQEIATKKKKKKKGQESC